MKRLTSLVTPREVLIGIIGAILIGLFFSYRLIDIPTALTVDEAAFAYNATLLAQTAHDQNGRFMPVFVLSIEGHDWRQPVTQYYLTGLFKIFGPSIYLLRFSSVLVTLVSSLFLYILARQFFNRWQSLIACIIFLTTPLIMIQSHMGLDNIMPIPFTILWLLFLTLDCKKPNAKYIILAACSLGISFYTYKGMRAVVPVWSILTLIWLARSWFSKPSRATVRFSFNRMVLFVCSIAPFFLIIPLLDLKYPGAVFDKQGLQVHNWYNFFYPFISSFDLGFLYITGDSTIYHSTGRHGMLLLASLPLFLIGIYHTIKRQSIWFLVIAAFVTAPLLYGVVDSVHRASRLMCLIPPYVLICTLGVVWLWEQKGTTLLRSKATLGVIILLFVTNYISFIGYYWFDYAKLVQTVLGVHHYKPYQALAKKSQELHVTPYVAADVFSADGESGHFYNAMYFHNKLATWAFIESPTQSPSILLSGREHIVGMDQIDTPIPSYYLQKN